MFTFKDQEKLKKLILILLSSFPFMTLAAEVNGIQFSGEAVFDYNFLTSKGAPPALGGAQDNQYRFNSAQLIASKDMEQFYFFARLTYVPTSYKVSEAQTSTESIGVLKQFDFFYKVTPKLHIGFGRFLTTFGYESPMRSNNIAYNYSIARQTLYPIYAEGIRAKYQFFKSLNLTVSNYNRIPEATYGDDNSSAKATEVSLSGIIGKLAWFSGYIRSRDEQNEEKVNNDGVSLWSSYTLLDNLSLIGTYDHRSSKKDGQGKKFAQSFSGTIAYRFHSQSLYVRHEIVTGAGKIDEINGSADFKDANRVTSLTLGNKFTLNENLYLYAELRNDHSDKKSFSTKGESLTENLTLLTLGAIARF